MIRIAAKDFRPVAADEGWSVHLSPVRHLILEHLRHATAFGLTPRRLARLLFMAPSTLSHHLQALEGAGMIERRPRGIYDGRQVAVRPTPEGRYAARRLESVLRRGRFSAGARSPAPEI